MTATGNVEWRLGLRRGLGIWNNLHQLDTKSAVADLPMGSSSLSSRLGKRRCCTIA